MSLKHFMSKDTGYPTEKRKSLEAINKQSTNENAAGTKTVAKLHTPSLAEKLFFLASGIIVSIPMALFFEPSATFLSNFFSSRIQAEILSIAILAPLVEEFAKAYPLFYRHGESQKSLFTLGFLVGVGFGTTEFFEYVVFLAISPLVRLPGIFLHASFTSITAYGIATKRSARFYLIAFSLHSSINSLAIAALPESLSWGIYTAILATTFLLTWTLYRRTSEKIIDY
jgi:RsiW-degrading membrane proteinase PrsW (M82 family)